MNITDHPKIMFNSPEVFWHNKTTCSSWAQKHKYFKLQKSFMQSLQKWKTIYIKNLQHNFVQFLAQELVMI
jgi:hypothetical protein